MSFRVEPLFSEKLITGAFVFEGTALPAAGFQFTVEREAIENSLLGPHGWTVAAKAFRPRRVERRQAELWLCFGTEISFHIAEWTPIRVRLVGTNVEGRAIWPPIPHGVAPAISATPEEDDWSTEFVGIEQLSAGPPEQPASKSSMPPITAPQGVGSKPFPAPSAMAEAGARPSRLLVPIVSGLAGLALVGGAALYTLEGPASSLSIRDRLERPQAAPIVAAPVSPSPPQPIMDPLRSDRLTVQDLLNRNQPAELLEQANRRMQDYPDDARRLLQQAVDDGYGPALLRNAELVDPSQPAAGPFEKDAAAAIGLYDQAAAHGSDPGQGLSSLQQWLSAQPSVSDQMVLCGRWPQAAGCGH